MHTLYQHMWTTKEQKECLPGIAINDVCHLQYDTLNYIDPVQQVNATIDLFTHVFQFMHNSLPNRFDSPPMHNVISMDGIHFAYIDCCYVGQASDKLFGCQ